MTTDQKEVTFKEPCCANCAAWKQTQGLNGECHLLPPVPLFGGFQQPPQVQGLQLSGRLPPQPIILGAFPAVNAQNICRQWQSDAPAPTYDTDTFHHDQLAREAAKAPGEGLVTREVPFKCPQCPADLHKGVCPNCGYGEKAPECPVEGGAYLPVAKERERAAEGAKHQDELAQDN